MGLRTLIHKRKNAKAGVKYLERQLVSIVKKVESFDKKTTDENSLKTIKAYQAVLFSRLEKKRKRFEFWTAKVKEAKGEK